MRTWQIIVLAAVVLLAAFVVGLFGGGNPDQRFWRWFEENSSRLAQVQTGREPVADELHKQMNKVCQGLAFLFGPVVDGRRDFIVSADGNKELFPVVQRLVQVAPDIPGWKIIAFRPPLEDVSGFGVVFRGLKIQVEDYWFSARRSGDIFELDLFHEAAGGANGEIVHQAAFLLLDHVVGEYNVETKIGPIRCHALPDDPAAAGLRPLAELPQVIR